VAEAFELVDQPTSVVFGVLGVAAVEESPRQGSGASDAEYRSATKRGPRIPACERLPISYEPSLPAERGQSLRTGEDGSPMPGVNCQRCMDALPTTGGPMAAAGTHPTPTKHPRAREERERARKSATEDLQQASAEIDKARQEATADVRRSLDCALERMHDVSAELRQRAEDQTAERQDALEHTSDKARRQIGGRGIRARARPRRSRDSRTRSASR
jgi:hypothetical protein